ncbi:ankyrin repeat and death domain-containing protein 1A-like isoform X4 [Crassostrea angulata]|uniref:ankyrin repeat and death domain-containing protein 1A-like isoform X4 n=1 Tax=Magallana angulata TaxID=2784310 RepID=UPI0022B1175A|nr:ankyrin repeat and death domain-containing protein 1A-like isoform X4 [Crassostrea angulata]
MSDSDEDMIESAEVDEELRLTLKENDCGMSTILEPSSMTKGEINFHKAAKENDLESVRKLLSEYHVNVNCKNNLDRTALHWASANGNIDVIEKLVEDGADLESKDKYGMRPVLWAAWFGHLEAIKVLITGGATPLCTNKQGMGILHCAAQNNHVGVMNFIFESLENMNINEGEITGRTPLHLASEAGHIEAVMRLIDMSCDANARDKDGKTALHLAAEAGKSEVIRKLLNLGVEVSDRDADGKTAMHIAAEEGHLNVIEVLFDFDAKADTETIKEMSPLHFATSRGHSDIVTTLIEHGAQLDVVNFQGNTPLHLAALGNQSEVTKILIKKKCQVDIQNYRQQTALHIGVEAGYQDIVEILLGANASLDLREKLGKTPLQLAARGSFVAIVDMIIKAERYYEVTRDYHEKELDDLDPHLYLRQPRHPSAAQMKDILWKLATKQLKPGDWKKLALYWKFTAEHIRAIEHQYTGTHSYKEHGFRLLMIWLHGVRKDENVMRLLFEALSATERRNLAEQIRRRADFRREKFCMNSLCSIT